MRRTHGWRAALVPVIRTSRWSGRGTALSRRDRLAARRVWRQLSG